MRRTSTSSRSRATSRAASRPGAGLSIRITASDGGTVLIDAGQLVFDAATGDILESHGPHHFDDYFVRGDVEALQPLCDALA